MGFFKPAWQSDNKDKALRAVAKETDQLKLAEIIETAPLYDVRIAAVEKLTDQKTLADIAKDFNDGLEETIYIDQIVSVNRQLGSMQKVAIKQLTDQKVIADVAIKCRAYASTRVSY